MNNNGADQPAHSRSLISAFVVCCLDSIIPLVSISSLYLASLAVQAGLCLTWSQTPKTDFLVTRLKYPAYLLHCDQALHCLPFCLHLLDIVSTVKSHCSNFRIISHFFWWSRDATTFSKTNPFKCNTTLKCNTTIKFCLTQMTNQRSSVLGLRNNDVLFEPHHEKTCLRGSRPGKTQTGLRSYRS